MDLFTEAAKNNEPDIFRPLADRLRPKNLEEFIGQEQALGKNSAIRSLLEKGQIPSLILWGPPGCGKTTFAELLSNYVKADFLSLNAISTGAKDIRELGERARNKKLMYNTKSLVFIDEVHRLNRAQQDVLLPFVEKGDFQLVAATTENPSFHLNSALLSRCRVVVFKRLEKIDLEKILQHAFSEEHLPINQLISAEVEVWLVENADGDARNLLNALEQLFSTYRIDQENQSHLFEWPVQIQNVDQIFQRKVAFYDRRDSHYDTISAFIKSIRGSNADGAIYYLARMLKGGEDPLFIARRLVILASEDVGNADPRALQIAIAGMQAVDLIGMPEAAINLAQVTTYLATAPKSNRSYMAFNQAMAEVEKSGNLDIPLHIRNAPTKMMKQLDYGRGYQYSHNYDKGHSEQKYLPKEIEDQVFYEPLDRGHEKNIRAYMEWLKANLPK